MSETIRSTSDLGLAAYIRMKAKRNNLSIKNVDNSCRIGTKFEFKFEDPESLFDKLSLEYSESESFAFDNEVRVLKTLLKNRS